MRGSGSAGYLRSRPAIPGRRRVEETDVLGFIDQFGQEDRIRVGFAVVEIFAVAGEPPEEYALVLQIPMVDGQQDVALFNAPYVGQRGHERTVDHVPPLAVVLLLLVDDREERGAAFAHGKRSEFGKMFGSGIPDCSQKCLIWDTISSAIYS